MVEVWRVDTCITTRRQYNEIESRYVLPFCHLLHGTVQKPTIQWSWYAYVVRTWQLSFLLPLFNFPATWGINLEGPQWENGLEWLELGLHFHLSANEDKTASEKLLPIILVSDSFSFTITLKENYFLNERMHDPECTKISTIMWMCGSLKSYLRTLVW